MSKLLFISNLSNKIASFATASIAAAHDVGMQFYHVSNWSGVKEEQIRSDEEKFNITIKNVPISRNPLARSNVRAYRELVELVQKENIDYIHCNTPTGGLLGRLVGRKCRVKKVIYQAHGFHFYKGASKKNWLIYYPMEKLLAHDTDALITINQEDYELAKAKMKLRNHGQVYYVPGVGIDTKEYISDKNMRNEKRLELGIPSEAFVLLSVGELNVNKNNQVILSAMKQLKHTDIHYVLCGVGSLQKDLQKQADEAGLHQQVHFLGYRSDVKELYQMSDCFVMSSYREGLSRSIMEAMAIGLPCVVSRIRGNVDLIKEAEGGFTCRPNSVLEFATAIEKLYQYPQLCQQMSRYNRKQVQNFDFSIVKETLRKIYERSMEEEQE